MNIYAMKLAALGRKMTYEAPDQGQGGGADDEAAKQAAEAEAARKAEEEAAAKAAKEAEDAADKAAQEAEEAKRKAEKSGTDEDKKAAAEAAELLREVMDKKAKLKEKDDELTKARQKLEAYEGIDPAKVKELLKKESDAEKAAAEAKGDFDRVKKMMAEEHQNELAKRDKVEETLRSDLTNAQKLIDDLTVGNQFGNSDFISDKMTLSPTKARRLYGDHFEMKDGEIVAYDKPSGKSERTMLVNADGNPLSFEQAIEKIVMADPDSKSVLRARMKQGADSKTDADADTKRQKTDAPKGLAAIEAAVSSFK